MMDAFSSNSSCEKMLVMRRLPAWPSGRSTPGYTIKEITGGSVGSSATDGPWAVRPNQVNRPSSNRSFITIFYSSPFFLSIMNAAVQMSVMINTLSPGATPRDEGREAFRRDADRDPP